MARGQPIWLNNGWPLVSEEFGAAGVGGANSRMKSAKFTRSADISETVLTVVPKFGLPWLPFRRLLESSGVAWNTHPAVVFGSLGNPSLVASYPKLQASETKVQQRLFLGFPAETRDGAVISAVIEAAPPPRL